MDTRFSSAIHTLILISESAEPMSSEEIAESVGTNASYIRKVIGLLKRKRIIDSHQGVGGFELMIPPEELSLYAVYQAIHESDEVHIFDLHQNPNDQCIVGRHIRPTLTTVFSSIEEQTKKKLIETTLADCMDEMRRKIDEENGQ